MTFPASPQRAYQRYLATLVRSDADAIIKTVQAKLPQLLRMINSWVLANHNFSLLDVGCGYGALIYALHQDGYRNLSCKDYSSEQVEVAEVLGLSHVKKRHFFSALEYTTTASAGMVIAYDVLGHV
jgi:2-polyprenyl-3-methyl-5-hydroxy-6-metoxy-1,4-benzoquinol methylase